MLAIFWLVDKKYKDPFSITMDQVQWSGVPVEFKARYEWNGGNTLLRPIVLTLFSRKDVDDRLEG
jgi:hypothetical protein